MSTLSMMIESTERLLASVRPSTPPIIVSRTSSLRSSIRQKSSGSHATSTKTERGQHPDASGSRDAIEWTPSPRPDNAGLCKRRKHLGLSYDRLKESMSVTQLRPRANEHADQSSTTAKESNNALSVPESHSILGDTKALYDSGKVDELGQQQLSDRVSLKPCEKETGQARNYSKTSRKSTKRGFNTAISKEKENEKTKRAIWTQIRDALRIDDGDLVSEIRNDRQVREPVKSRGWPCNVAPPPPPPPQWKHSASNFFPRYALGLPQEDVVAWVLEERTERMCAARTAHHGNSPEPTLYTQRHRA